MIDGFLNEIVTIFPEVKVRMDMHEYNVPTFKMEEFANATTFAMASGQVELAKKYMDYIDSKLACATHKEFEFIDVYYVEHLFWNATDKTKEIGWPLVPSRLQDLYIKFHGKAANS